MLLGLWRWHGKSLSSYIRSHPLEL
jgi:hypothetical protein